LGNLATPISLQKLQTALHAKAKAEPEYRFYALYDKMYRKDVLEYAYRCCRANKGAAGVDDQTFQDIEEYGQERWLGELAQALSVGLLFVLHLTATFIEQCVTAKRCKAVKQ
jgi:RNA-directed DNA polymerase